MTMKNLIHILFIVVLFVQCGDKQAISHQDINLGEIEFKVSSSEEAAPYFHEGLLLLHSFEFEDAADKFVKAQQIDSNFVMAYWGEAMTFNHPLWKERYSEEGTAALKKLADTKKDRLTMAKTPLEFDLLEGVEILYTNGDKKELDIAYKNHMEKLYKKYPEHHEVAAFYALSLLGSSKSRKDDDNYEVGAKIAQSILSENPHHPGALHYLIHSYDDPDHATLALDAANRYSKVAPDAEHALHMPSHIFVALGMWDEVINSNIASYEASVVRMKKKELDNDARGYHAFKWLMYGYLQKGDFEKAREMVYDMKQYCEEKPSSKARAHYIMMKADYLTESGNWKDSIANDIVDLEKLNLQTQGVQIFTQGMSAYKKRNKNSLNAAINDLNIMQTDSETQMVIGTPKMCSGISRYLQPPSVSEVNSIKVLKYELMAFSALLNKNEKSAEKWMQQATEAEETTTYNYGPPNIVKPSFELYGEWLVEKDRKKEARQQFEKVLKRAPKRRLAIMGLENTKS